MRLIKFFFAGLLVTACGVSAAQDCSDISGDWEGTWSETDCDNDFYSGDWTGVVTVDCQFTGFNNFDTITGSIDPITGFLSAPIENTFCGDATVTGTFQDDTASGGWSYTGGGGGTFNGTRLIDTDGDGDPDVTDPDDDNDGIADTLDRLPLDASNAACTTNDGINATLVGATISAQQTTCASAESIVVSGMTNVGIDGDLLLISESVSLTDMSVTDNGRLEVINADPCPGCPPP